MFQIASLASISTQVGFMAHPWSLSPVVKGQAGCSSSFLWGCIRCNPQDLSDHSSKTNISGRLCNPFLRKMLVMQQLAPDTNEVESGVVKKVPQLKMENLSSPALWVWSLSLTFPSPTPPLTHKRLRFMCECWETGKENFSLKHNIHCHLNEKCPSEAQGFENLVPSWWLCLWRLKCCRFANGSMWPVVRF